MSKNKFLSTMNAQFRSGEHCSPWQPQGSKNKQAGISLLTLIITIIVIIILAAIVIFTGLRTPDSAQFAKFTQDVDNVQTAVRNKYADLKTKHAIAKEYRTDEQIYIEIATAVDPGQYASMNTTSVKSIKDASSITEGTGIQNIIADNSNVSEGTNVNVDVYDGTDIEKKEESATGSLGMTLPKVREYNTAWYVTKDGRVFNANGFAYSGKTYYDAKHYTDEEKGSTNNDNADKAIKVAEAIENGTNIVAAESVNGEIDGNVSNAEVAKDLLYVNLSANTNDKKSPYVKYVTKEGKSILCKVIYNDDTYGVQMISVGVLDESFLLEKKVSYNEAVMRLNEETAKYIDNAQGVYGARVVGSNPIYEKINERDILSSEFREDGMPLIYDYGHYCQYDDNGRLPAPIYQEADQFYEFDEERLKQLDFWKVTNETTTNYTGSYYLGSRYVDCNEERTEYCIRFVDAEDNFELSYFTLLTFKGYNNETTHSYDARIKSCILY